MAWIFLLVAGLFEIGFAFFKDPISFWRVFFIAVLVGSIIGLKLVSHGAQPQVS